MDNIDYCVEQALAGCEFDREAILKYARTRHKKKRSEVLMSIKNGEITKQTFGIRKMPDIVGRWRRWRRVYQRIVADNPHWDMDLILHCADMPNKTSPVPMLSICSFGSESQNVPVPVWSKRGVATARRSKSKWNKKKKKVNFVGAPRSSGLYGGVVHPRVEFCNWASNHTQDIYAKITNDGKGHRNWKRGTRGLKVRSRGPMSIDQQLQYRYLLNIDGNSTAWYRLPWQMASNSVCMHLETNINGNVGEWHYPLFEREDIPLPFIWVTQDNILDIKRELDRDEKGCHEQIEHGNSFVETYLSDKSKRYYTTRLFEEINSLME